MGYKVVVTQHAVVSKNVINKDFVRMFLNNDFIGGTFLMKVFFVLLYRSIPLFSDLQIVHTNILRSIWIKEYGGKPDTIRVVMMGVPDPVNKPYPAKEGKKKYFFYFGYIVRRKGLDHLIKGFARYVKRSDNKDVELILSGGTIRGQEFAREEIKDLIEELGMSNRIRMAEFLEEKDIRRYFEDAYAVVMPALVTISASGPLSHARTYGKCVIASKVGNFREEIEDKVDGILVENTEWEEALSWAVENQDMVSKIELNVIKKAKERSWDNTAALYLPIYEEVNKKS
jgi:glycosyltransferase involved in cell wall biosynthesis